VKTRFIPEHVASKGPAGKRHYHAILKHILKPEAADALFDAESITASLGQPIAAEDSERSGGGRPPYSAAI
jgi:hypothetical protein